MSRSRYALLFFGRLFCLLTAALLVPRGVAAQVYDTQAGYALPGLPFWRWQNPLPQNYFLNDLYAFTDSAALLVGDHGTALRTADQGRSWHPVDVGTSQELVSVSFANAQTGWIGYSTPATDINTHAGGVGPGEVRSTRDGGLTWTRQPIGENYSVRMRKVIATSATTVYAFYEWARRYPNGLYGSFQPRLRRSNTGGQTWLPLTIPVPNEFTPTNDLVFPSPTVGFVGGGGDNRVSRPAWLQRTTDGGRTWQSVLPDSGRFIPKTLFFLDAQQGWVGGYRFTPDGGPVLFHTTDGGTTWVPQTLVVPQLPAIENISLIRFAPDGLHGLLSDGANYRRSADGGVTWTDPVPTHTAYAYYPIAQLRSSGVAWVQTGDVELQVTTDFADSLRVAFAPARFTADRLSTVAFPDPTHGWAGSAAQYLNFNGQFTYWTPRGRSVLRTTDRGAHWRVMALDSLTAGQIRWTDTSGLNYVSFPTCSAFPDRDTAYVAGVEREGQPQRRAFVVRTTDGGATWTRLPLPRSKEAPFTLQFLDGRRGILVGDSGLVAITHDAGQTWQQPATPISRHYQRAGGWLDAQHLWTVGDSSTVGHSADGGLTWQVTRMDTVGILGYPQGWPAAPGGYNFNFDNGCFLTPNRGFWADGGTIMRTLDGGASWYYALEPNIPNPYIQANHSVSPQQIVFRTPLEGYAFGDDQLRTLDGGNTWTMLAQTQIPQLAGVPVDRYNAFTVGYGTILRYSEKFIQTDTTLARTRFCLGGGADSVAVAFTTEGTFAPAEQDFRVELSNRKGRFRKGETTLVGRGAASPLLARLPAGLAPGTYRLRVIRADSTVLGADNGVDLLINQRPAAVSLTPADSVAFCASDSAQLTAPAGYAHYQWSTGATTPAVWVHAAGVYAVQVGAAPDCLSPPSSSVRVRVKPVPAAPTVTAAPQGAGLVVLTSSAAAGNQWFFNGQPLAGATGPTYVVSTGAQSGSYAVQVTAAGCPSPLSAAVPVSVTGTAAELAVAVTVSPNPARTSVAVRAAGGQLVGITLTDLLGRVVSRVSRPGAETVVPLAHVAAGTYLLRTEQADGTTTTHRLIVEK